MKTMTKYVRPLIAVVIGIGILYASIPATAAEPIGKSGKGGGGSGGMLMLNRNGVTISIPLDGVNKDSNSKNGPSKAAMSLAQNRSEIQNIINGILDLDKDRQLAITKAQAKKLLPIVKKISDNDILGFKNTPHDPKETEALVKTTDDYLFDLEEILTPKQLGAIDEILMKNPQTVSQGGRVMMNKMGGGPASGLLKGIDSPSDLSAEEIEKIKKEAEANRAKAIEQNKAKLEKCLSLLKKKTS